jgi:hypothetical protein
VDDAPLRKKIKIFIPAQASEFQGLLSFVVPEGMVPQTPATALFAAP